MPIKPPQTAPSGAEVRFCRQNSSARAGRAHPFDFAASMKALGAPRFILGPKRWGTRPSEFQTDPPGKLVRVSTGTWFRARMATPFQEGSPCQTASYPRARRAFTGKAPCSVLSSWRLTTSGSAFANQARRLSSRLLMLLMLKVASFNESFPRFLCGNCKIADYPSPDQPYPKSKMCTANVRRIHAPQVECRVSVTYIAGSFPSNAAASKCWSWPGQLHFIAAA